jgi:hypothetical protein
MVYMLRTGPRHNGVAADMTLVPATPDVVRVVKEKVKEKRAKPKGKTYGSASYYHLWTPARRKAYQKAAYQRYKARQAAQRQNGTTV